MQLKVVPNDSRCSCGKSLETKEEQKNPPTQLRYQAITLVSFCRGMLICCCEINWNYLNCLYIIPEKWVHLGHMVLLLFTESKFLKVCEEISYLESYSFIVTELKKQLHHSPKCRSVDRNGHSFLGHFL